jgi:hypothetical protein
MPDREDDLARCRRRVAERKRKSRRKRKAGLESYRLYLPTAKIAAAIRVRSKLPKDAVISPAQIKSALADVIGWWAERWIRIGHE